MEIKGGLKGGNIGELKSGNRRELQRENWGTLKSIGKRVNWKVEILGNEKEDILERNSKMEIAGNLIVAIGRTKTKLKYISAGNTIDCFECNSWDDPRCHDPWNWTYPKVWSRCIAAVGVGTLVGPQCALFFERLEIPIYRLDLQGVPKKMVHSDIFTSGTVYKTTTTKGQLRSYFLVIL